MMIRRRSLTIVSRQKFVITFFVTASSLLCLVLYSHAPRAARAGTESVQPAASFAEKSQNPPGCCGGDEGDNKPHLLAGSYYTLKNNMSAELLLNNKGPIPIETKLTLFSMKGERFDAVPVTVDGNAYRFIDLATVAAIAGPQFREGSMRLLHRGKDLVLGAQIYLTDDAHSLSFEEKLLEPAPTASTQLAGVWWLPTPKGVVRLVVSNTTGEPVVVATKARGNAPSSEADRTVVLRANETKIVDLNRDLAGNGNSAMPSYGAISVQHDGPPGAVLARGMAEDPAVGYSLPIQFSDPKNGKSTSLQGAGLRIGKAGKESLAPKVVAYNASDKPITLNGRVTYTTPAGINSAAYLPPVHLTPGNTEVIDVQKAMNAHGQTNVTAAGLEFDYAGAPGSIVTSAFSVSKDFNHVFRVPLWDIAAQRSATGGYPWYIEGDSSTIVYIKNVTDEPQQYTLQLRYDGGVYALGLKTVEARQTVALDIRALREQQIPDESGHPLPLDATHGQVNWSMRGPQNQVLIGRSEQVDLARGISSNYACMNCCPDSFSSGWIDPGDGSGFVSEDFQFNGLEQTRNCYGSYNAPFNPWPSWDSTNPNVMGLCSSPGLATAEGAGSAYIEATWHTYEWGSFESGNPHECYARERNVLVQALCQIAAGPDHLVVLGDQSGYTSQLPDGGTCIHGIYFLRQIRFQVVSNDSNGAAPVGNVIVKEEFDSHTHNTCGNGDPIASGCATTINNGTNSGTFIDTVTTGCGSPPGPANCGYDINWSWHWCGRVNLPIVKLASLTAQVRRDSVTINGNSGSFAAGTAIRR